MNIINKLTMLSILLCILMTGCGTSEPVNPSMQNIPQQEEQDRTPEEEPETEAEALEEESTTEASPAPEVSGIDIAPPADDDWKEAYLAVVDNLTAQMTAYTAPFEGALMYIDNDNIPEMFVYSNLNPGEIFGGMYTYQNGEAVLIHPIDNREFYYGHKEKSGEFATHGWWTDNEHMTFFTMNGTSAQTQDSFRCEYDMYSDSSTFTINGMSCSKSEYKSLFSIF